MYLPGIFGRPLASWAFLLNQSFEAVSVLRLYSYAAPWNWSVPLLVTRLAWAPAAATLIGVCHGRDDAKLVNGVQRFAEIRR